MDSSDEEYFASLSTLSLLKFRGRRFSVHPINQNRKQDGEFYRLYEVLRQYPDKFFDYTRMRIETFDVILNLVKGKLVKNWTNFTKTPILPTERFVITLRFLATGSSFAAIGFSFYVGRTTVAGIVHETCQALWEVLQPIYMPVPTEQMFKSVANEYWTKWNFPNCMGAIDGKHINVKCPAGSGSMYYNYKGYHSIVLQAVADANCKFLIIEIGGFGKQSDGGTFSSSDTYRLLKAEKLNVPADTALPDPALPLKMPFVFVGDEAYPLIRNLIRPFPRTQLNASLEYFNARLSRARKCVECAFGIMTTKWTILKKPIETKPEFVDDIVKAICILHNVIIDHEGIDTELEDADKVDETRATATIACNKTTTNTGRFVRDYFREFMDRNKL